MRFCNTNSIGDTTRGKVDFKMSNQYVKRYKMRYHTFLEIEQTNEKIHFQIFASFEKNGENSKMDIFHF